MILCPFLSWINEVRNYIMKHSYTLNECDLMRLRNLIFNPFSLSGRGKSHLMLNSDFDPGHNYYTTIINYIDTCDYHDDDSFKRMAKDSAYTDFSILHLIIKITISSLVIGLKMSYFPLIRLPSCYQTVCYWIVCYWTVCYRTV